MEITYANTHTKIPYICNETMNQHMVIRIIKMIVNISNIKQIHSKLRCPNENVFLKSLKQT